jgi:hypothetical protein
MSPKRATDLVKGIVVDLDAALASNGKDNLDERHSALASAMMLGVRLFGGATINLARIAGAMERIDKRMEADADLRQSESPALRAGSTALGGADATRPPGSG